MYFTRWNAFCQIVSTENSQDLRKNTLHTEQEREPETVSLFRFSSRARAGPDTISGEIQLPFFAILAQESFSATVRLNTGCSAEWSFGSEKK